MLLILSLQPSATIVQLGNAWGRKLSIFSLENLTSVHSTRETRYVPVWKLLSCFPLTCSGSVSYTILSVKQERLLEELDDEAKIHIIRGPRTGANSWRPWAWTVLDLLLSAQGGGGLMCHFHWLYGDVSHWAPCNESRLLSFNSTCHSFM